MKSWDYISSIHLTLERTSTWTIFSNRIRNFMKRTSLCPRCYLCIYTWTEEDTKAILIRTTHGLESARNLGKFYTQRQQLLPDKSPVCSFNKIDCIVNNSSEDA